ncbi:MAG: polysaccharide pyruvyl transferase family protein [Armatimonadia bacterium]
MSKHHLVMGWFSFELMGATAGDVIAKDVACDWLRSAGFAPDEAMVSPGAAGEIATADVVPEDYDTLLFVCGPIGDGPPLNEFLDRFPHARKFALNVTLLQRRSDWNPFVAIVERDSHDRVNPDITFAATNSAVPVVGLIYVGPQEEYPTHRHDLAEKAFAAALQGRDIAVIPIDTRLDVNRYGLTSPGQVEAAIAKMDAILTTRLHGAVLALRRHVPPVVIDSIPGGTKVLAQMERIGWPLAFHVGDLDSARVAAALDFALTPEAREFAAQCASKAAEATNALRRELLEAMAAETPAPHTEMAHAHK